MDLRRALFVLILGPVFALLLVGSIMMLPMVIVIGYLLGEKNVIRDAWRMMTEAPIEIFLEGWRGCNDPR